MKQSLTFLAAVAALALLSPCARAQTQYTFDPQMTGTGGSNGGGTWDTEVTADWYDQSSGTDTTFPSYADGPGVANFDNVGGTVDVSGNVSPLQIVFGGSGTYTLSGGSITLTPGASQGYYDTNLIAVNSGNVVVNSPVTINEGVDPNIGQVGFSDGGGTLTLNGGINITNSPGNVFFILNSGGSGSIVDNAAFTGTSPGLFIAEGNSSEFGATANANGAQLDAGSGNFLVDTNNVTGNYSGLIGQSGAILLNGAVTVGTGVNQFTRNGSFGGATADDSTFEGSIQNYVGTQSLVAAAGGKVNFDAEVNQFGGAGTGSNLLINETSAGVISTGVVSLNNATGQTFGQRNSGSNSDVGTEIVAGTLLIMNTSGSATGNGALGTMNNTVQLDTGAALGGTGFTQQNVVAQGATSVITPGDMTKGGVSSIGTLHLDNGLSALNGLTANFQLAGPTTNPYDQVEVSTQTVGTPAFALALAGPITINLSGTIDTADTYTLFYSAAGTPWEVASGVYTFNGVPTGYTAVESYDPDDTSTGEEELNVSFVGTSVPEPSTWALIGLAGLVLISSGKLGKLRA